MSWRHFMYGLAHIGRANARESLRQASASGIGFAKKESADHWFDLQRAAAGWMRG